MDKVQITKEQAEAIEKHNLNNESGIDGLINKHANEYYGFQSRAWGRPYECLNSINISTLAKVLYTEDYEIKSEFEIGDYVFCTNKEKQKSIGKITNITGFNEDVYVVEFEDIGLIERFMANRLRNATEEEIEQEMERRWWAEHGRDFRELKNNDIVSYSDREWGGMYVVTSEVFKADVYRNDHVRLYNRHRKHDITIEVNKLKVICFAEDRKDIHD